MPKKPTDLDKQVEILTSDWVSVSRKDEPNEYRAWWEWRRDNLKSKIEPDYFTVPTKLPPMSIKAAQEYCDAVKVIRRSIGWNNHKAQVTSWPAPWYPKDQAAE